MNEFNKIILIGNGRVAKECLKIASNFFMRKIIWVGNDKGCDIDINNIQKDNFFNSLKDCFIISANNFYIFKEPCIVNNLIINYHNSLLPNHRGMNAHIWAIYNNDITAGITWHFVNAGIDTGEVILQKQITTNYLFTSLRLILTQHNLAISCFKDVLLILKNSSFKKDKFKKMIGGAYHKAGDLPNNGILDLSFSKDEISRLLRAFDVGIFRGSIPKLRLNIFNEWLDVDFYSFDDGLKIVLNNNMQLILKENL